MVQVQVKEGILEGEKVENEFGGIYYSFKGIPYASPPVGDLRFKAPQPPKPWKGVRSAKEHGPICYQYDMFLKTPPRGSEDCLYLNVYTPDVKPAKLLPVMFWIHGGGFMSGSGDDDLYGPEFLVRHDVILVTCNYRLEVLGFLCLHTEDIPGNAGMKDQVAALRWVRDNISSFGGDPDNVTIFGESAGGASVTFHLISPMSKGLFKKAIAQSGVATNSWATPFEPQERAKVLARNLGCKSNDDKEIYEFFKSQPVESLIKIFAPVTLTEEVKEHRHLQFGVVSEKQFGDNERFFSGDVYDVLRDGMHEGVEVIAGYCEDEGIVNFATLTDIKKVISQANAYPEVFVPQEFVKNCPMDVVLEVGRKIKHFYYGKNNVTLENFELWLKSLSMGMFIYGIVQWQKISSIKNRVYMYKFACKSERNLMCNVFGADKILEDRIRTAHADDLAYIFPLKALNMKVDKNSDTFKMINTVTRLWTNFAKTGDPTPDFSLGVEWPPFGCKLRAYMKISDSLVMQRGPCPSMEFWEAIYKKYLPHCYDENEEQISYSAYF